jgi:hypothetical protein
MRKLKLMVVFATATAFTAPAFSIIQVGGQGNYSSLSYAQGADTQKYSGFGFGAFARFTAGIPLLITFGAGPYLDYGTLTKSSGSAANGDMKNLRAGGEVVIYLDVVGNLIGVTPYARFGFGYEGNTVKTTYTVTNTATTATADAFYYGTSTHMNFGLTMKVFPLVYIFAEGGLITNSLKASIPSELSSTVSASDINSTGWRMSLGAMIWL